MKTRQILITASVTGLLLFALGCSSTRTTGEEISDLTISTKIAGKFVADPEINPFKIDVDTSDGVVRLSGTVKEESQKQEAEKLARRTDGVVRVMNDISVGEGSIGQRLDDAGITTRVKARLAADPEINPFDINVDAEGAIVTLLGRVKTEEQREEAERLARDTDGVEKVVNRLEVGDLSR